MALLIARNAKAKPSVFKKILKDLS